MYSSSSLQNQIIPEETLGETATGRTEKKVGVPVVFILQLENVTKLFQLQSYGSGFCGQDVPVIKRHERGRLH